MEWNNCFTEGRFGEESTANPRTSYERDYDRIIFSSAFRRLQNKTQVFPLPKHIFVHNRLTHSLEVASVGRSLGKFIGKDISELIEVKEDQKTRSFYKNHLKNVIAAACLAHDLGNPAFGHSGEEAISKYFIDKENDKHFRNQFSDKEWKDLTNFEGNANSLRILTKQFNGRLKGGFRLTYPTLASIIKYPCESNACLGKKGPKHRSKYGFVQEDRNTFLEIAGKLNMLVDSTEPLSYFRHPFVYLVEAADDICYNIIDFEDAHRLKILSTNEVEDIFTELIMCNKEEDIQRLKSNLEGLANDRNERIAYLRAKAINYLTIESAKVFKENKSEILKGKFNSSLIGEISDAKKILKSIEDISYKRIYNYESVVKKELSGFVIMSGLIEDFVEAVITPEDHRIKRHKKAIELIPYQFKFKETDSSYSKVMCVIDFMSGMTDLYALELYKNIKGIEMPSM